ncbi:F-box/kelch-repeat protein At3g23880-like [Lycium barbarum]|uniref:F-box/kelch-repeat protein At3g23880-like n=1 Tax=Lycium barbarum TaxID=112863 RepID=UPI00293F6646|nr:F-box/kelch-repeat protein At3g23880-like [Lycium barbarum]
MSDYLPKDVLGEILSKLPLKPLIQFTTVCKTWYSIITNPNFISFHHNILNNNPNRRPLLFIRHYNMFDKVERYALHFDDEEEGVVESESDGDSFDEYLDLKCPETTRSEFLRIVGCCKGVVCLSDDYDKYTDTVVLWNPIVRKHLNLPRPNLRYNGRGSCIYGFGFDVVKCDYKVVRVVYNSTATEDYKLQFPPTVEFLDKLRAVKFLVPPGVEVYSLSSGAWRSVSGVCPSYILHQNHSVSTYLNGGIHWIASNSGDDDNVDSSNDDSSSTSSSGNSKDGSFIVAFDVGTEIFSEISLPESVAERNVMKLDVMVTGPSLALIEYEKFWQSDYCWVWVMKEYGEVKSWSRLHNIDLRGGFRNIVGFRSHGELLISARMVGMVSYNPKKRNISYLGIHGTNRSFHGEPFFESLALVGKEDRFVQQADSTTNVVQEVGSVLDNGEDGTQEHT